LDCFPETYLMEETDEIQVKYLQFR
jgi:hypothetical protein